MYIEDKKLYFKSNTDQNMIKPLLYLPQPDEQSKMKQPQAVVLIIHGMAEHQLRYSDFAEYLSINGFAVCTLDLPGHGKTAPDPAHLGYFSAQEGTEKVHQDIETLMGLLMKRFPKIPHVIFGHSMGSLIARHYCARTERKIAGAVFSGTPAPNALAGFAGFLAARSVKKNGPLFRDEKLNKLMNGSFLSKLPDALTPFDWISSDEEEVQKYIDDPLCGFVFTAAGFRDLFKWIQLVSSKKWAAKVPVDIPIFIFSGSQDPVGAFGAGVKRIDKWLKDSGHHTVCRLYKDGRHEMLNEKNRYEVWENTVNWLNDLAANVLK